jgi:hypothetical protein
VALTIRVADLGADRELIIDTLRRYLTPLSDAARFDWLYRGNPYGPAAVWIAVDDVGGETVGMASAFPRRAVRDGKDELCWVLGDFCIHTQYRTLGPALQLNRACLAGVGQGAVAFCYDFPSVRMMAVYRRLGIVPFGQTIRFVKVLRWGRKLREMVSIPGIRTALGILGAIGDLRPAPRPVPPRGTTLALEERDCDAAFDDLDRANRKRFRLYLERSAAYLNWRYRANPLGRYEILSVRTGGELQGYAAFTQTGPDALLTDLFAREDDTTRLLLGELTALLRGRDAVTLSAPVLSLHPLIPHLLDSGFQPREATPVILHSGPGSEAMSPLGRGDWPLSSGDRDS